jgi:hypothetical protein
VNAPFQNPGLNPFDNPLDRILAEVALSVQLPPSLHKKAKGRYSAVCKHLEAQPAFNGQIEHFYSQGSMAIDATISTRGADDEYDLDAVAQLGGSFRSMEPLEILLALEKGLAGYPVTKVVRQTRCVTLYYADQMHLDVTPSLRAYGAVDRESWITHAKGPDRSPEDHLVDMNAYGFADWYRERTPVETALAKALRGRWMALDAAYAAAEVDEVPDQCEFGVKNTATLALQLIKRFRNIRYFDYDGRIPPSVMLSYYAGMSAKAETSLSEMVIRQAKWIIGAIERASLYGRRLHVASPVCERDVFTDRWPSALAEQNAFADHLRDLVAGLETVRRGDLFADRLMEWLRANFGSHVVTAAADRMADDIGATVQAGDHRYGRRGGLLLPSSGLVTGVAAVSRPGLVAARTHTFFGVQI